MELPKYVYAAPEDHEGCGFQATVAEPPDFKVERGTMTTFPMFCYIRTMEPETVISLPSR